MANIKSAEKDILVNARNQARNQQYKTRVKSAIKQVRDAVQNKAENRQALLKEAIRVIDKTVSAKVLHKKTAARRKSRLTKAVNAIKA